MSTLQLSLPDTLDAVEISQLLDVFAETFSGEPSFRHMFPDSATRTATTRWVGTCKWRLFGCAYRIVLAKDRGKVVGFSLWLPPGVRWPSLLQELRAGFYRAPLEAGIAGTRRMLSFAAQEAAITGQHATIHVAIDPPLATPVRHTGAAIGFPSLLTLAGPIDRMLRQDLRKRIALDTLPVVAWISRGEDFIGKRE